MIPYAMRFLDMPNSNGIGFEAVHSDVSELWAICVTGHAGMLGGLVGSLTKVAVYSTYALSAKGCGLCLLQYQVQVAYSGELPG